MNNRLLILGYSRIAEKRVIPAAVGLGWSVEVATRSRFPAARRNIALTRAYAGYEEALRQYQGSLVYVSTRNSEHYSHAGDAIDAGFDVIVDKPAFLNFAEARRALEAAETRGKAVSTAVPFLLHPQFAAIDKLFLDAGSAPSRVSSIFSFPPLPKENFRNNPDSGGGALLDLAAYAMGPGRHFFGTGPKAVYCSSSASENADVVNRFSLLVDYGDGKTLVGHFGFDTEYHNRLTVIGPRVGVTVDRAFTTPADMESTLSVRTENQSQSVTVQESDSFAAMLGYVADAIDSGHAAKLNRETLEIAQDQQMLLDAARNQS